MIPRSGRIGFAFDPYRCDGISEELHGLWAAVLGPAFTERGR